jgi:hypothetical protein
MPSDWEGRGAPLKRGVEGHALPGKEVRIADRGRPRVHQSRDPASGDGPEVRDRAQRDPPVGGAPHDGRGERMLGGAFERRRKLEDRFLVGARGGPDSRQAGFPSVRVPVLSRTSHCAVPRRSSASAFLMSTPDCAPSPRPP